MVYYKLAQFLQYTCKRVKTDGRQFYAGRGYAGRCGQLVAQ